MNHRMVLGRHADVRETAGHTLADERATDRIIESVDREHDERVAGIMERRKKERDRKRRNRAVGRVKDALGDGCADVLKAWLNGRTWCDIGIPERTFRDRLKKVKIFFHVHE